MTFDYDHAILFYRDTIYCIKDGDILKEDRHRKKPDIPGYKFSKTLLHHGFKVDEFAMRGLNRYKNFLFAVKEIYELMPGYLVFKDEEDFFMFCSDLLIRSRCTDSAIFCVHKDGTQEIFVAEEEYNIDKDEFFITDVISFYDQDIDAFAKADAGLRLVQYGLLIEKDEGWMICA